MTADVIVKAPFKVNSVFKDITELPYNKQGTLKCDITAASPMHITWYLEDKNTGSNKQLVTSDKYTISKDGTTLTINGINLDMVGKYTCKAVLDKHPDKVLIYGTQVKVSGLEKPKLSGESTKAVKKGPVQSLDIQCKLLKGLPQPTISWQFKAKGSSTFIPLPKYNDLVLRTTNVDLKDEGSYKCIATNIAGVDEHVTVVTVEYAPGIKLHKSNVYRGREGDVDLKIPCDVVGVPQPTITWKKNGVLIDQRNPRYSVVNGTLFIKNPKQNDTNKYTCVAKNYLGIAEDTFEAIVDTEPEDFGTIVKVMVEEGTTLDLRCGVEDSSQKFKWYKELKFTGQTDKFYHLEKIPLSLEGNYTCHVSGKNGDRTMTYAVNVGYAPRFKNYQKDSTVDWTGSDLGDKLDCEYSAKPAADVVWSFNGKVINGQKSSRLSVPGARGHYTCDVSNDHGTIQRSFNVISSH